MPLLTLDAVGIFLILAGFSIGLGAVTVIDLHGFLGRHSAYWTEATIRTHKITKPLIWVGMLTALAGGLIVYRFVGLTPQTLTQLVSAIVMILNGCFLSFVVSPHLLRQEALGKAKELLPKSLQIKITLSFIISFIGWWGNAVLFALYISNR